MLLDIRNLSFSYKNSKSLTINNISFDLDKGEILAILGKSGSGKSTILRLIAGLEKLSNGSIKLGDDILDSKEIYRNPWEREVGMVFQDYALFPHMTVEKNIMYGLTGITRQEKKQRVKNVLALVSMTEYTKRYPHELSGGQQQRIALARAIAPRPKLILMDEPFSNLDTELKQRIRQELKDILKSVNSTCIFVTHDIDDAKSIADRIIIVEEGIIKSDFKV